MYATNHLENTFLNIFRGISAVAPSSLYIRLYLSDPGESGTGGVEVSYSGYDPQPIVFSPPAAESGGIGIRNSDQISFPIAAAGAGQISHIGICDSKVAGNMWLYGQLVEPLNIQAGEAPVFLAGEVLFYLIGDLTVLYKTKLLNLLRGTGIAGISPYFALYNGDPDAGGIELVGANYARASISFSSPQEQSTGVLIISNSAPVSFLRATTDWGVTNYRCVMESDTGGSCVLRQAKAPKQISRGRLFFMNAGDLKIGLN